MKLLLLLILTTLCCVNGDKSARLLAAILAGNNGGLVNGVVPVRVAGGLNPPVVMVGGAGFVGQPQFAQLVPAYAAPAPVPNQYNIPAVNSFPYMGVPQTPPLSYPRQPLTGFTGGLLQQQLPLQPLRRFRRQIMEQDNTLESTMDTQIPAPTAAMKPTPCNEEEQHEDGITEDTL